MCVLGYCMASNHAGDLGGDANVQDPEGYTPLHMAAGYLHTDAVAALLAGGADISRSDRQGRDIPGLVDSLRDRMNTAAAIQQRTRLEEVSKSLTYHVYEDVAPAAVLAKKGGSDGGHGAMYLVRWRDGSEDSWVPKDFLSTEVRLPHVGPRAYGYTSIDMG
jgi:signal recognition particle 43 kDa protein